MITNGFAQQHHFDPPWNPPIQNTLNFTVPGVDNVPDIFGDINDPQLGKLVVMNATSGHEIRVNDLTNDSDGLFYDEVTKLIYVSCGGGYANLGYINIFQFQGGDKYTQIANIPNRNNARTSLLVPPMHLFLLAEPSDRNHEAQLLVYKTQ